MYATFEALIEQLADDAAVTADAFDATDPYAYADDEAFLACETDLADIFAA